MAGRRMTRDERRAQLVDVALEIVRVEGASALSLVRLAERAGVSRPVVYEHFGTRERLLLTLFRAYDVGLGERIRAALAEAGDGVEAAAGALSAAYVDGFVAAGVECDEIAAALAANKETRDFMRESRNFYLREFRAALAPRVVPPGELDEALLAGLLGALEALGREAAEGRIARGAAVTAGTDVLVGALRRVTPKG
ncbi:TetR/AcrR family transcriptional regulator [Streptomyces sp. DSM 44915]|uniref:TetR/AcrR family transcriptional regulator n=1 Tax=Streptomyces chisholmiae TaxID=3075540 RepID=A0ABU2JU24_9ACTN|nr:TetR/AcrR family transcriptional regulator [Streptomyces sp. DSM 44915]MDT0268009.1 TetR/AcrR family transcriptional regulator [Streptomyces sp. DSM 44915]